MICETTRHGIYASTESENRYSIIEYIFLIFFLYAESSCRCRESDESFSCVHRHIHMRMRSCTFMKKSSSNVLVCDDPLLRYLIDGLLDTRTLHIVAIWEHPYRK
jgi:hypothetical protein